jgi:hypothetical protein
MPRLRLDVARVLGWAEAHRARAGAWPRIDSGPVPESPGETWRRIDNALRLGLRGLEGGSSLARLLERERGVPARADEALRLREQGLTLAQIGRRLGVSWQAVRRMLRRMPTGRRPDGGAAGFSRPPRTAAAGLSLLVWRGLRLGG